MPARNSQPPSFKPAKDQDIRWSGFKRGWNNLFKPTELRPDELSQADNLMLIGEGTPTGRWGTDTYSLAGETGKIRLIDAYYNSTTGANLLLSLTDDGYLTYKNGASYTKITGASFASGYNYQSAQIDNNTYFAAGTKPFVKFDGTNLIPYTALSSPSITGLTQLSAASGFNTYSWLVTAVGHTGETGLTENLIQLNKSLASLPLDLSLTSIKVQWTAVSAASGVLTGYNVYRGFPGDEAYVASVGPAATEYIDTGVENSSSFLAPDSNNTAGIKAKYILKVDDRLVLAGIEDDPSKVIISGRYPYHDRFTGFDGGGAAYVSPNDGDDITGLGISNIQTGQPVIIVFKKNSVHTLQISTVEYGGVLLLDPQVHLLTASNGCSSSDTIVQVENDTYYFGRKGLYVIGQEPQYLNQIRTNELSARIRPYVRDISESDFTNACAGYIDNKYVLSFPSKKECVIYDRERLSFMGPWKFPWEITKFYKYYDSTGTEKWLIGTTTGPYIREFSASYISDSGTAIAKLLRTKKEDMGDWSVFKILKYFYVLFRNVRGTVGIDLRIEQRDGNTVTTKSFNITSSLGSGGWGNDQWGAQPYGQTDATVTLTGDELARYAQIYKNCRVMQIEVSSSSANDNWEFLGVRMTAQSLGDNSLPATTRV